MSAPVRLLSNEVLLRLEREGIDYVGEDDLTSLVAIARWAALVHADATATMRQLVGHHEVECICVVCETTQGLCNLLAAVTPPEEQP